MSEKTYVFGEGGGTNGIISALAPMLQNKGIDPGVLAMMNNNGFGGNGAWIWIFFLAILWGGWGGRGFGGANDGTGFLASQLNNDYGRDVLLQAINGNATAISQLATTLNCDINAVQGALNSLSAQVQSGNANITSQLASCCCDIKGAITTQGYENRIANAGNTADIISKIDAQTNIINDKFCALEMREMQNKIDALRDEKLALQNNISQRAQNEYIASSLYPISTALTELRADFDCFKSHLPETVTVQKNNGVYLPYTPAVAVPNCVAAQYGFGPFANVNPYGAYNRWDNCNGSLWG